jgi:hypothetical protein
MAPESWKNSPSKVTDGDVHSCFISARPSVNLATYLVPDMPNAPKGRRGPPEPTPTSTRPPDIWSSEAIALARCTGLCKVVTKTVQPSRSVVVQAAAYVIASSGDNRAALPSGASCAQALSKTPSSSARAK